MPVPRRNFLTALAAGATTPLVGRAQGQRSTSERLVLVEDGRAAAKVHLAADAGSEERLAANDLIKYVEMMSGARLELVTWQPGAGSEDGAAIILGQAAVREDRSLTDTLQRVAKKNPLVNADAIVLRRAGRRLYVAGNNDRAHYFAASRLLHEWGCRWYLPTDFGEVVPDRRDLTIDSIDIAFGSPFEIRHYWLAWRGDSTGLAEFHRRNFASAAPPWRAGHALGRYTKELAAPGTSVLTVPLSDDQTIAHVTERIDAQYAKGVPGISLAIEDGRHAALSDSDAHLQAGIADKYMLAPYLTDAMMTLYNGVARNLKARHPQSPTKILGLAYSNVTLPPQRVTRIESSIVMWLAPIDIDPNHGMDDPESPPRQEFRSMMYRWSQLLEGRLLIRDYDQGQLVWRDLPNPSQHVFAQDVRHYRKAGALGAFTESRGATATVFLNLFFRLQLLWDPDLDVDATLAEFYPAFYGPAAEPMARYWTAIFHAWRDTLVTEHEYFVIPAIYTEELVRSLKGDLAEALARLAPLRGKPTRSRNEDLYLRRATFTSLSFEIIESYCGMVRAAATENRYAVAAGLGRRALDARTRLTAMNPTFTNDRMGEKGSRWLPGEIEQYRELSALSDGTKGTLVARTPLEWAFRRDPRDTGLARGWNHARADLAYWDAQGRRLSAAARKDYPDAWEMLRTDVYMQAQGIRHPDGQSYTGFFWYQAEIDLSKAQATGALHLMFPGLFNECWLYANGVLVAHRTSREPWWRNDYRFEWDVDVSGALSPGTNLLVLRGFNPHHYGGMFRRPFLYRPA